MRTRAQIKEEANKLHDIINAAKIELNNLQKEDYLLCDEEQWFTEKEETTGRGKTKQTRLIGRVNWNMFIVDEDTNEKIYIPRSHIVRIDGVWTFLT